MFFIKMNVIKKSMICIFANKRLYCLNLLQESQLSKASTFSSAVHRNNQFRLIILCQAIFIIESIHSMDIK